MVVTSSLSFKTRSQCIISNADTYDILISVIVGSRPIPPLMAPAVMLSDPTPRPALVLAKDKGKENEVLVEPHKRWTPVHRKLRRQHAANTLSAYIQSTPQPFHSNINVDPSVIATTHTQV